MAGLEIPRAQRQVEDPTKVRQGRAVAPTAGTQAQAQLGAAIAGAGEDIGRIGGRILKARERMQNEELLNNAVNASTEVQNDLVQFIAKEKVTAGLDTSGNVERFNDAFNESFQARTADMPDEVKALVQQRLGGYGVRTRTDLAIRQQKQRRGVTFSNLDQARDVAIQEAANNPTISTMEEQIKSLANDLSLYKQNGSIDAEEEQDRFTEGRESIIKSAINSASLQDPEAAQLLLDQTKAILPSETVTSLETDIRKQSKLQEDKLEAVRTETVQTFTNEVIDLTGQGTATITAAQASPVWQILEPDERQLIESIIEKGSPFNESNEVVLADFTTRINVDAASVSIKQLVSAHGRKKNGLSTADFNKLFKQRQDQLDQGETPKKLAINQGYTLLKDAKTNDVYSSNELENSIRWSRATQAYDVFIAENPEAEPEDYTNFVQTLLDPDQKNFINRSFDFNVRLISGGRLGTPAVVTDKDLRTESIKSLTEDGQAITEANIAFRAREIKDRE